MWCFVQKIKMIFTAWLKLAEGRSYTQCGRAKTIHLIERFHIVVVVVFFFCSFWTFVVSRMHALIYCISPIYCRHIYHQAIHGKFYAKRPWSRENLYAPSGDWISIWHAEDKLKLQAKNYVPFLLANFTKFRFESKTHRCDKKTFALHYTWTGKLTISFFFRLRRKEIHCKQKERKTYPLPQYILTFRHSLSVTRKCIEHFRNLCFMTCKINFSHFDSTF